jgi:selenocysteine lyase/cysteine desulfurase
MGWLNVSLLRIRQFVANIATLGDCAAGTSCLAQKRIGLAAQLYSVPPGQTLDSLRVNQLFETAISRALESYSNVHRGTGQHSLVSTELFEFARDIIQVHFGFNEKQRAEYTVIFGTPARIGEIQKSLKPGSSSLTIFSREIGLPIGFGAVAVRKIDLPKGVPLQQGGGTVKLVTPADVAWAETPDLHEAGTPNIIGAIMLAKALILHRQKSADRVLPADSTESVDQIMHQDELTSLNGEDLLVRLQQCLIGRQVTVPTERGAQPYNNLDNGASTPTFTPIWDVVKKVLRLPVDKLEQVVRKVDQLAELFFGAPLRDYRLIYTSNTTEAINVLAENISRRAVISGEEAVVLNTTLEHNSNELPWRCRPGISLVRLGADGEGFIDLAVLEKKLSEYNQADRHHGKRIRLVTISGASNVLGSFNNIKEAARLAHKYGAEIMVDAAQLAAHREINMAEDGIDHLVFSGHKMYAPFGTGGLISRRNQLIYSDYLEAVDRSGRENVAGIAAIGKAMELFLRLGMRTVEESERVLTRKVLIGMRRIPGVEILGANETSTRFNDKGSVVTFRVNNVPHNLVGKLLAERSGIGVRTGCFCAHILLETMLKVTKFRMFITVNLLKVFPRIKSVFMPGVVRVGIGLENTEADIDSFLHSLAGIATMEMPFYQRWLAAINNGTPFLPQAPIEKQMEDFVHQQILAVYSWPEIG